MQDGARVYISVVRLAAGHRILQTGTGRAELRRFHVVKLKLKWGRERNQKTKGLKHSLVFSEQKLLTPVAYKSWSKTTEQEISVFD